MKTKYIIDKLLMTFGSSENIAAFCNLRTMLDEMHKRSKDGDKSAARIVKIAEDFIKLVEYCE